MERFRGGLGSQTFVSLNSRLESLKKKRKVQGGGSYPHPAVLGNTPLWGHFDLQPPLSKRMVVFIRSDCSQEVCLYSKGLGIPPHLCECNHFLVSAPFKKNALFEYKQCRDLDRSENQNVRGTLILSHLWTQYTASQKNRLCSQEPFKTRGCVWDPEK